MYSFSGSESLDFPGHEAPRSFLCHLQTKKTGPGGMLTVSRSRRNGCLGFNGSHGFLLEFFYDYRLVYITMMLCARVESPGHTVVTDCTATKPHPARLLPQPEAGIAQTVISSCPGSNSTPWPPGHKERPLLAAPIAPAFPVASIMWCYGRLLICPSSLLEY